MVLYRLAGGLVSREFLGMLSAHMFDETEAAKSMTGESVLIGALIGAAASIGATTIADWLRHRRETHALEASLVAEVKALLDVIEARGYVDLLEGACKNVSAVTDGRMSLSVPVPENYARVYQANAHQVGRVRKQLAQDIVRFHQLIEAVAQDVRPGGALAAGGDRGALTSDLALLKDAIATGLRVIHNQ